MAGVLGFEPRMAVPKTAALPLGYTPKLNSYITKKINYIVFDTTNQYFLYFFLKIFDAVFADFFELK